MCITRREVLQIFSMALPVSLLSCWQSKDVFDDERVCVHVFNPDISIPQPLLRRYDKIPTRAKQSSFFEIGIPELLMCTTSTSFLRVFQYFWPITRQEFHSLNGLISIKFEKSEICGKEDIVDFLKYLEEQKGNLASGTISVVILTLNDYTKYWCSQLITIWQGSGIEEFVIFKDPTRAPYLCDFPSLQKGFKRPPP